MQTMRTVVVESMRTEESEDRFDYPVLTYLKIKPIGCSLSEFYEWFYTIPSLSQDFFESSGDDGVLLGMDIGGKLCVGSHIRISFNEYLAERDKHDLTLVNPRQTDIQI